MTQDFCNIRKGTNPKTAFKKASKVLWEYILDNSYDFKTLNITMNVQADKRSK